MSIVAGVDFGTLSVRVALVDTNQGKLGSGAAEEPTEKAAQVYKELDGNVREMYFGFGKSDAAPIAAAYVLSSLRRIATRARGNT